jgi:hypothetical protein
LFSLTRAHSTLAAANALLSSGSGRPTPRALPLYVSVSPADLASGVPNSLGHDPDIAPALSLSVRALPHIDLACNDAAVVETKVQLETCSAARTSVVVIIMSTVTVV